MKLARNVLLSSLVLVFAMFVAPDAYAQGPRSLDPPPPVADADNAWTAGVDDEMPTDPAITVGQLDNGLMYWIRENGYPAQRAEVRLVVRVGSVVEDDDQQGLAHFVEHMAFNGTENFPKMALVEALESFGMRFGADINASTGFDETTYFLRIPTDRPEIVDTAFQILEDWAHNVSFEPEEIDKERGVVIEEWRLGLGAGSRVRDQQLPVLFQDSKYAERLPIGNLETLENFPYEAATRFYRDWYRPELMGVIAVGDFDAQEIKAKIEHHFGGLTNPENPRPRVYHRLPEQAGTRTAIVKDAEATYSSVEFFQLQPLRRQAYHGSYRRTMTELLFSLMFNRRLAEQAQQPNPPFLVAQASQDIFLPTAEAFVLSAAVRDGETVEGLQAVFRELERVARFGFTESELEREKRQLVRSFERIYLEREAQDSTSFAEEFTRAFVEGESTPGIDYEWALYQRYMPGITLEAVNAVGSTWLRDDNRVILVTTPDKDGLQLPAPDELIAAVEANEDGDSITAYIDTTTDRPLLDFEPEAGFILSETTIDELGVTEWTLSNGVKVVLKPTDFRADQVLVRAFSPGGTSLVEDDDWVAASSAVNVVSASGFGGFSARGITNHLADKVVNVRPFVGELEEGFLGQASPRDVETLFRLMYLQFTAPRADEGVFNLIQEQMKASIANRDVSPDIAFQETLATTLSQNHPRRRPISADVIDEMDLEKSYNFYRDRFADASDFTFVFVGNVDIDALRPLAETYLASLPSIRRDETWRDEGIRPPRGVIRKSVNRGVEPRSITAIVFTGEHAEDSEQSDALGAMTEVLQTRLREVLREELSGTYGVGVNGSLQSIPHEEYQVSITFGSGPERVEELAGVVFDEIARLKAEPPSEREVENVRESSRRQRELSLRENGFWVGQLVNAYQRGKDPLEILEFDERLAQVTPAAIQTAAAAFLDLNNYVQVSLFPESMAGESGSGR